jgi:MSHA biogenesis protein MshO
MNARGFTLIELVISIAIASIVVVFAAMFIGAPIGAYEAHSRRAALVADTAGAWPRMEKDLHAALPNSLRTRRNGVFVVIEMLKVTEVVRYIDPPSGSTSFKVAGGGGATPNYLSVMPGADVYAPGSLASAAGFDSRPEGQPGEYRVTLNSAPSLATSPRQRLFFVEGPVTYLCDERQGTMRRYANYAVAEFQAARATPGAFGVAGELVARGLTSCNFVVDPLVGPPLQTAAIHLTTTRYGDSITLLHTARPEYAP